MKYHKDKLKKRKIKKFPIKEKKKFRRINKKFQNKNKSVSENGKKIQKKLDKATQTFSIFEQKKIIDFKINRVLTTNKNCYKISHNDDFEIIKEGKSLVEKNYDFWEKNKKEYFNEMNYIEKYIFKYDYEISYNSLFEYEYYKNLVICYKNGYDSDEEEEEENEEKSSNKEFQETKIVYCRVCNDYEEMYYGICLKCGDDDNMGYKINPKNPPLWLPDNDCEFLKYKEQIKFIKEYLRFQERLDVEEINALGKEFEETIIIYCPSCDEVTEMYYGICLNCGNDSEKKYALNEEEPPEWMPSDDLIGIEKAIAIRNYLKDKEEI